MTAIQHFARNTAGRDFAVGDIHGHFDKLELGLDAIGFDGSRDRLFSVGDLVDRGPHSEQAIDWIAKPWFHAVRGNHEQMAIGVAAGRHDPMNYFANGGGWFLNLDEDLRKEVAQVFDALPYAIEIDAQGGRVGIVHADIGGDSWDEFVAELTGADSNNKRKRIAEVCLWSRTRIQSAHRGGPMNRIHDLAAMIVGHTPVMTPVHLANVHYIDTGAGMGSDLTIVDIDDLIRS